MVISSIRHLQELDELMKKIQLEAMGITLGIGVVGGLSFSLLDITNIILFDAEISHLILFMGAVYLTSLWINYKRYK